MSTPIEWREQAISRDHDRASFDCGVESLNLYLLRYARQNHLAGGAKTFVAEATDNPARVLAFYSISPGELEFSSVPNPVTRGLGHYNVPVFRLGRLAVDKSMQGQGIGSALLAVAAERALRVREEAGGVALAIDAIDVRAAEWYQRHGALRLVDDPLKLVLPLATIARAERLGR